MSDVLVRFVGRFGFLRQADVLHIVAMNMGYQSDLRIPRHRPLVAAPLGAVLAGAEYAESATVPNDSGREFALWDLTSQDLSFVGLKQGALKVPANPDANGIELTDLRRFFPAGELRSGITGDVIGSAIVAARLRLRAGTVSWGQFDQSFYLFEPPVGAGSVVQLADFVDVVLSPSGDSFAINLASSTTGQVRSIAFDSTLFKQGERLIVTNICVCTGSDDSKDREFAAYYDLFRNAPAADVRPVPVLQGHAGGAGARCFKPISLEL